MDIWRSKARGYSYGRPEELYPAGRIGHNRRNIADLFLVGHSRGLVVPHVLGQSVQRERLVWRVNDLGLTLDERAVRTVDRYGRSDDGRNEPSQLRTRKTRVSPSVGGNLTQGWEVIPYSDIPQMLKWRECEGIRGRMRHEKRIPARASVHKHDV